MKRLLIAAAAMTVFAAQAVPASAAEGLPGATVRQDGGKSAVERRARKARAGQRKGPGTSLHPDRAA